jgi:hypothetical protein
MSNDPDGSRKLGRRDTLKLATAVSALGVGLGVLLDSSEAAAETVKLNPNSIGKLTLKLYKENADDRPSTLLHTIDFSTVAMKGQKAGNFTLKLFNQKVESSELVMEHGIVVTANKD